MKRILYSVGILLLILSVSIPSSAKWKVIYEKAPLYEDESGWQIWNIHLSEDVLDWYYDGKFRAAENGVDLDFPAFERIGKGPYESFYVFMIIVPDEMTTYWSGHSAITMFYVQNGDTLETRSTELFVQKMCGKGEMVLMEERTFPIPSPGCTLFSTPEGYPIIFAKFPLTKVPDKVLYCAVENVMLNRRR